MTPPKTDPFKELLGRPSRTRTVSLAFDPADADKIAEARRAVKSTERTRNRDNATDLQHQEHAEAMSKFEALEADVEKIVFRFEAIGVRRVDALMTKFPPSKEDHSRHKAAGGTGVLQYDPDRFPPALIAATCTKITLPSGASIEGEDVTPDVIDGMFRGNFSQADQAVLFNASTLVDLAASTLDDILKG